VPGRAEPLAQRGELAGYRAVGGDRTRLGEHCDDLSRVRALNWSPGVSAGQDPFGLQHEQTFAGRDRHGLRSRRRGLAAACGRRPEGKPYEAGSVADQVKPPGAARGDG
jgi:hypothetical protein